MQQSPGMRRTRGGVWPGEPPLYPQQPREEKEQPRHLLRTLKPGAELLHPSPSPDAACWSPAPLASIPRTPSPARAWHRRFPPRQVSFPGRHSSSLWFYIKQTLPASSPAGPGNRAADLGHLGTVPPLYLDFGAKFSICKILCKPRQRGHREVGALPAHPGQQLSITVTASKQATASPLDAPAHEAFS